MTTDTPPVWARQVDAKPVLLDRRIDWPLPSATTAPRLPRQRTLLAWDLWGTAIAVALLLTGAVCTGVGLVVAVKWLLGI